MVVSKILHYIDGAVPHVADADSCRGWLGVDKSSKILELSTEATAGRIVEQEEQLECCIISLQGNPIGGLDTITPLINHHIFFLDDGHIGSMTGFRRYHDVHWGSGCWRLLGRKQAGGDRDKA